MNELEQLYLTQGHPSSKTDGEVAQPPFYEVRVQGKYPHLVPLSAGAGALLFIMCLSLLFFGAGAFAFDLPL